MREKDKKVVVTVCKGDCCRFGGDYKPQRMVELGLSSPIGYVTVKEDWRSWSTARWRWPSMLSETCAAA